MTLVVNLYGGPGTGKSTTAAGVFHLLKTSGYNIEYVHEFAKELTWENRTKTLGFQPYVIGKQMWMQARLFGQVDVVITDSPILLGLYYQKYSTLPLPHEFAAFVCAMHKSWNTLDVFLARDLEYHPYNPKGRNQTQEEALAVDEEILNILYWEAPKFKYVTVNDETVEVVTEMIEERLSHGN